jgi:hypothetical protein
MTAETKTSVKARFEAGDQPTQTDFENLIDSYQDAHVALSALAIASTAAGFVEFTSTSVAVMRPVGTFGRALVSANTTAIAIGRLGLSGVLTSAKTALVVAASGQETTVSFSIPSLSAQTTAASTDQIVMFDVAASSHVKVTRDAFNKLSQRIVVLERTADITAAPTWGANTSAINTGHGFQIFSAAATPTIIGSRFLVTMVAHLGASAAASFGAGIFVNAGVTALSVGLDNTSTVQVCKPIFVQYEHTAASTSTISFRARAFATADRIAINRNGSNTSFANSLLTSSFIIEEYIP